MFDAYEVKIKTVIVVAIVVITNIYHVTENKEIVTTFKDRESLHCTQWRYLFRIFYSSNIWQLL